MSDQWFSQKFDGGDASENCDFQRGKQRLQGYKIFEYHKMALLFRWTKFEIEKRILLQSIDINWKLHIQYLEQLRQVIGLRSYGQRDPLIEYKKEAFVLFENLLDKIKKDFIKILFNLTVVNSENEKQSNLEKTKVNPKYVGKKMSRNEPCFCGSGKKYKHCCGRF